MGKSGALRATSRAPILPAELLRVILLELDRADLCSVARSSRHLTESAEEVLYTHVSFPHTKARDRAMTFFRAVLARRYRADFVRVLILGRIVATSWPIIEYDKERRSFFKLQTRAIRCLKNVKRLEIAPYRYSPYFHWRFGKLFAFTWHLTRFMSHELLIAPILACYLYLESLVLELDPPQWPLEWDRYERAERRLLRTQKVLPNLKHLDTNHLFWLELIASPKLESLALRGAIKHRRADTAPAHMEALRLLQTKLRFLHVGCRAISDIARTLEALTADGSARLELLEVSWWWYEMADFSALTMHWRAFACMHTVIIRDITPSHGISDYPLVVDSDDFRALQSRVDLYFDHYPTLERVAVHWFDAWHVFAREQGTTGGIAWRLGLEGEVDAWRPAYARCTLRSLYLHGLAPR